MSDAYEDKHMGRGEDVVYRDKFVAGKPFHAIMLFATLLGLIPLFAAPVLNLGIVLSSILPMMLCALIWMMFSVLRVSVSTSHVHIQLGLLGPRVAIEDIESAQAVQYDWKKYGGWGIRMGLDGSMAFNFMSDAGRAVELKYRNKSGNLKTLVVSSRDPDGLVRAIESVQTGEQVVFSQGEDDLEDDVVFAEQEEVHETHA